MGRPKGSKNKTQRSRCRRGHPISNAYCSACAIMRANRWKRRNPKRRKEICRNWYWSTPKQYRDNLKAMYAAERRELRDWIDGIKLKSGCVDCGYKKYSEALDFDHLRDKKCDIAGMCNWRLPKESILKEMQKCEIVCANCHRHRTRVRYGKLKSTASLEV